MVKTKLEAEERGEVGLGLRDHLEQLTKGRIVGLDHLDPGDLGVLTVAFHGATRVSPEGTVGVEDVDEIVVHDVDHVGRAPAFEMRKVVDGTFGHKSFR